MRRPLLCLSFLLIGAAAPLKALPNAVAVSSPSALSPIIVVHPAEGAHLPPLSQVFVYGSLMPGSTMTINNAPVPVHPKGGFLTMVPVSSGPVTFVFSATTPSGDVLHLDRHFFIAPGFTVLPSTPVAIDKMSISPAADLLLMPGDTVRVFFQGSPGARAEFMIGAGAPRVPMVEIGTFPAKNTLVVSTGNAKGLYEGSYTVQPGEKAAKAAITVVLKKGKDIVKAKAAGKLTIDNGAVPRVGVITDDIAAVRTAPADGYDLFLYRGMRVRLTAKVGNEWRVRLSSLQYGWIKDNSLALLPTGTPPAQSPLTNFTVTHQEDSTVIRVPMSEALPYRSEQSIDPMHLVITLYGAVDKTDLIKYDPLDPLIREVRWRQTAPDTCELIIDPTFKKWWGYDVRYEGTTLIIEIRKPWTSNDLKGMVIAVDPGHGGSDRGAIGPHETMEKDANLLIAKAVAQTLEKAGAKPFLTREKDIDVPLYERARIAWNHNARLFVSIHCNASGEGENPVWNNGFSTYWYQPQSAEWARSLHRSYLKEINLPDHGLYYADLAVCRMTQMPAALTENAYIIVPEQEDLLFNPEYHRKIAAAILGGIREFLSKP